MTSIFNGIFLIPSSFNELSHLSNQEYQIAEKPLRFLKNIVQIFLVLKSSQLCNKSDDTISRFHITMIILLFINFSHATLRHLFILENCPNFAIKVAY